VLLDLDVLTQAHDKEESKSWELGDGTLQWHEIFFCDFSDDASGDYFLLFFFWVFIFVGSELAV